MKYHLQIIGEASRSLDPAVRRRHGEIPREKIIGMRNILVHDYGSVDLNRVWDTAANHIQPLKTAIERILRESDLFTKQEGHA